MLKNHIFLISVLILATTTLTLSEVFAQEIISITTTINPITILTNELMPLLDTSAIGNLTSLTATTNLPCDTSNVPKLKIIAGILGNTTNVIDSSSDYTNNKGPRDTCIFTDKITNVTAKGIPAMNRVFLKNTGSTPVHIPEGVMVTLTGIFEAETASDVNFDATGLLAYYTFEENPGSTAPQLTNHCSETGSNDCLTGKDGTVSGSITKDTTKFKLGSASFAFTHSTYISISDPNPLPLNSDFTIAAWIYPTDASCPTHHQQIVRLQDDPGSSSFEWNLNYNQSCKQHKVRNGGTSLVATNTVTLQAWNHVVLVRSGDTYTHYLNGVANGNGDDSGAISDQQFRIGGRTDEDESLHGNIDELLLFNRALSSDEIADLYNDGQGLSLLE